MEDNNRLIAEFMGYEVLDEYCDPYPNNIEVDSLPMIQYMFQDWNDLMQVVEKIKTCKHPHYYGFGFTMFNDTVQFNADNIKVKQFNKYWKENGSMLIPVYKAVVEFIKWYNENKK